MSHHHHHNSDNFSHGSEEELPVEEAAVPTDDEASAAAAAAAPEEKTGTEPAEKTDSAGEPAAAPSAEEQLAALRAKCDDLEDKYKRALADNENYRKRMVREMQDTRESTRANTISEIVGIFDLLKMALDSTATAKDMDTIQMGLKMIFEQFRNTLGNMGVSVIDAKGQKLDPRLHEAVSTVTNDEVPEGTVLQQWNFGFKLGDRILRPARVVVAAPSKPEPPATAEAAPAENADADGNK